MSDAETTLEAILDEHLAVARAARAELVPTIAQLAAHIIEAVEGQGKLIVFGNGGSAADAQHFAGELTGHYKRDRRAIPALALTTDTSVLTAIANDYSYEDVFARQVEALCQPSDVVVGISTSGKAENVIRGITTARRRGARTWALTGADGGSLGAAAEHALRVPSNATARIQEMHITVIHAVSELVDERAAREGITAGEASGI
jgi:D-sedoheptulose 7-phosphate isomerase